MAITFNPDSIWQVAANGVWNDAVETRQVYQLRLESGTPLTQSEGLGDIEEWLTDLLTILKTIQTLLHVWNSFTVADLNGIEVSGAVPFSSPLVGEATGDPLPPGVAMLGYFNTGQAHRQLRKYLPGGTEAQVTASGLFGTSTTAIFASTVSLFLDPYSASNGLWRYGHALPGIGASWVTPVSMSVNTIPSYQRRRRQGVGI